MPQGHPSNPHIFVTGHCDPVQLVGRDLFSNQVTASCGTHGSPGGKGNIRLQCASSSCFGQSSRSLVRAGLGLKTKSQGHLPSHLAKNTSQTLLLAAWCQQDLETLTELISALLSLAILVLSCLKGRVHLDMTGSGGSPYSQAEQTHRPESRRASTAEAQPCLCPHLWQMRSRKLKGSTELQQLQRVHTSFKAVRIKCQSCRQDHVLSDVSEVKYKCWLLVTALPSSTLETRGDLLLSPASVTSWCCRVLALMSVHCFEAVNSCLHSKVFH